MAANTPTLPNPSSRLPARRSNPVAPPPREPLNPATAWRLATQAGSAPCGAVVRDGPKVLRRRHATSVTTSVLLHLIATLVLGLFPLLHEPKAERQILTVVQAPHEQVESPVRMQFRSPQMATPSTAASATAAVQVSPGTSRQQVALAEFVDERFSLDGLFDVEGGGEESGGALGAGAGRRSDGASYFGIEADGRRFVYVVDASTSMAGVRWKTARRELLHSVRSLPMDAEFYIVFFSDQTHLMFGDSHSDVRYRLAGETPIKSVQNWINSIRLGDSTRPLGALRVALALNPDAVFLLTDGEFRDGTLEFVSSSPAVGSDKVPPIHTVALFSRRGSQTLQSIAAATAGRWVFVSGPSG